ncbi:uncharacterized protein BO88DRAFT_430257 [Aspergillus vadensis CBS 113365]|uniref:Uncharacterized protein n=1 Tax=Aspergillus vadensis (strain CBS 113365 / IMI 142717 / IBT 24658) TaxID=1448311 RepID=A0A319AW49_ASPVC|nr:hypothetical protein BO88DRAFT_430257 [Aspergillus vadensis CBS 113365]PYH63601.1 hypothetical protein BO88DRAFT_430257 [Aspergillus vadensis CBS 113365]
MSPSQVTPQQPDDIPPNEKSQYRMIKEAGFNGMHDFMLSHELEPYNFGDYDEANQIIDTMRRYDQEYWEAEQQERSQEQYEDHEEEQASSTRKPDEQEYMGWDEGPIPIYHDQYEGYEGGQSHYEYEDCEADVSEPLQEYYDHPDCGMDDGFYDDYYD